MKVSCGVVLHERYLQFSFVNTQSRNCPALYEEVIELPKKYDDVEQCIRAHIDDIDKIIKQAQEHNAFKTDSVYIGLPDESVEKRLVEDTIALTTKHYKKKITARDYTIALRQLEEVALDWQELSIHRVVSATAIDGVNYESFPLGIWAKKITIAALLVVIKRQLKEAIEELLVNHDLKFETFVYTPFGELRACFETLPNNPVLICTWYPSYTRLVAFQQREIIFEEKSSFSEAYLINAIAREFSVSRELARQLLFQYASFKKVPFSKEISIREDTALIHISSQTLNSFLRKEFEKILRQLLTDILSKYQGQGITVSFLGRIACIQGFFNFVADLFPNSVKKPHAFSLASSASGCVRYGIKPFLEQNSKAESLAQKLVRIYHEYF